MDASNSSCSSTNDVVKSVLSVHISRKDTGNVKVRVAVLFGYLGTNYYGLQWDPKLPTIEYQLEKAIYEMGGILNTNYGHLSRVKWARSSRTDKGVHALGNVVSLYMELSADAFKDDPYGQKIADAINNHLPPDIRVFSVVKVKRNFDPRAQCVSRSYNVLWPKKYLNGKSLEEIREILKQFVGKHNFHNFTRGSSYQRLKKESTNTEGDFKEIEKEKDNTLGVGEHEVEEEDDTGGEAIDVNQERDKSRKQRILEYQVIQPPENREDQLNTFVINQSFTRVIIKCDIADVILGDNGAGEWVTFKFEGGSFAYNQIRRMLGFALLVVYNHIDPKALPIALNSPFKFMIPMTPGECLCLESGTFRERNGKLDDILVKCIQSFNRGAFSSPLFQKFYTHLQLSWGVRIFSIIGCY